MHLLISSHFVSWYHRYAAVITSLMAKDCRYLLDTLLYNPELYPGKFTFSSQQVYCNYFLSVDNQVEILSPGPPFFVPDEQVQSLFSKSPLRSIKWIVFFSFFLFSNLWAKFKLTQLLPSSGNTCELELLQSADALTERQKSWGLDFLTENVFLLTVKSN